MNTITGLVIYKDFIAQQHKDVFSVFKPFLEEIKPSQILEIGTAGGGLTLFLRDALDDIGLSESKIKTFDVIPQTFYNQLIEKNIDVVIDNIFDISYMNLEKPEMVESFIQQDGTTLVLCDGGYKIGEFRMLSKFLKKNDYIMAHDYIDTIENFNQNYKDKIWNWCEIKDSDINESCINYNLEPYNKDNFDKIVWVCRKKIK